MFIVSYLMSKIYTIIFRVGIDTMLICFLIDKKVNSGKSSMKANQTLQKLIGEDRRQYNNLENIAITENELNADMDVNIDSDTEIHESTNKETAEIGIDRASVSLKLSTHQLPKNEHETNSGVATPSTENSAHGNKQQESLPAPEVSESEPRVLQPKEQSNQELSEDIVATEVP